MIREPCLGRYGLATRESVVSGLTLLIQNGSPGKDREANWLPAPKGPFVMYLRLYWPKDEAVEGKWTAPPVKRM